MPFLFLRLWALPIKILFYRAKPGKEPNMAKFFINLSNHRNMGEAQLAAAESFGTVADYPFPNVPTNATVEEIGRMADKVVSDIETTYGTGPDITVMVMGEMTLVYSLVARLQAKQIRCVVACTERKTVERQLADGTIEKTSVFDFAGFREYETL